MRTLYQFPISHYCEKTRWHLDAKGVSYRVRNVPPGAHRLLGRRYGVAGTVPFLVDGSRAIGDSTEIALHLEAHYDGVRLLPGDEPTRARVLELEAFFDDRAGPAARVAAYGALMERPGDAAKVLFGAYPRPVRAIGRVVGRLVERVIKRQYRIDRAGIERARAAIDEGFGVIEKAIDGNASRYLVGDSFTLADLTAASMLSPIVAPPESPYRNVAPAIVGEVRKLHGDRPAWHWIERIYREHRR